MWRIGEVKVVKLTRGDLVVVAYRDELRNPSNNLYSDVWVSGEKSAEAIVPPFIVGRAKQR
jgi:hypothetical protein